MISFIIRKILKIFIKVTYTFFLPIVAFIFFANWRINSVASDFVYDDTDKIPKNKVGLLLGTSKYISSGELNLYFKYRIEAAVKLYKANKINFILVSGDNRKSNYNEPQIMKKELLKKGIPENKIYLDYAGFRTFDSVIRAKRIFGQVKLTVISQEFHNKRAIFIGRAKDIEIVGFNAKNVIGTKAQKTNIREIFAKVKVFLDIYILNTQPKFLGEKIEIK